MAWFVLNCHKMYEGKQVGFSGNYLNKFDDAGRLSLPAKMREELRANFGSDALMAYCVAGVVKIHPKNVYDAKMKAMFESAKANPEAYKVFRKLNASAYAVEINSSGRMNIPAQIRNAASLGDECYELWNKEKWDKESAEVDLSLDSNAAIFSGFMDMII